MGEVTCIYTEDGAFSVQRGKASARVFADGEPPAVGDIVEAVGFPAIRDECGALVGALWRRTDAEVEPAEVHRLSLAPGSLFDLGGFMADNDLQFRLVELVGRVEDVRLEHGPGGRLIIDVDGQNVDVMLPPSVAAELPWGIEDRPIVRVRGVLDARVSLGNATNRLFSFEGFHLRTRDAGDIVLVPDWRWGVRRALGFAWIALLSVLAAFGAFAAVVAFRRHRAHVGAEAIAADRRRIAAELHDTISQHISGAKLWVYSAKMAAGDTLAPGAAGALVMAENVLEATRREIRDAIMDLQSDEFVSQSTESLLRSICRDASVPGKTRVRSFLRGLPADLPIRVKRDLLAIASEAIGNAVRHGGAANVIVVSEGDGAGAFTIDVLNDGEPFSADAAPGPEKGHFGISNMRERAVRSGMALSFGQKRGYVAVSLERRTGS
jgi:signal transduction histidine kinase